MNIFYQERDGFRMTSVSLAIKYITTVCCIFFTFFSFSLVHAEGTASFNSGNYMRTYSYGFGADGPVSTDPTSTDMSIFHNEWTGVLPTSDYKYIYTYAKAGEKISIGTNFTEFSTDVTVIFPNGAITNYDVTSESAGFIATYKQERNGPKLICTENNCDDYYTPISISVSQTGLYKIAFYSGAFGSMNNDAISCLTTDALLSKNGAIAAYDITVTEGNIRKNGRSFTFDLTLNTSSGGPVSDNPSENFSFYVVASDGVIYRVLFPLFGGGTFGFLANKRGIVDIQNDVSLHHSIDVFTDRNKYRINNSSKDDFYRIFYNAPDEEILSFLGLSEVSIPNISNFKFAGVSGDYVTPCNGGVFSFSSDKSQGSYQIDITAPDGSIVSLANSVQTGTNSIAWNGRKSNGTCISSSGENVSIPVSLKVFSGETHIVFYDIEINTGGIKLEAINVNGTNTSNIYYDNSQKTINGVNFSEFVDNADHSTYQTGINSKNEIAGAYPGELGNHVLIDYWTNYLQEEHQTIVMHIEKFVRDITVVKHWVDDDNRDLYRTDRIQFNLFCGSTECGNNPYTITKDDNWEITVPDIPIYDSDGQEYTYSVTEIGIN